MVTTIKGSSSIIEISFKMSVLSMFLYFSNSITLAGRGGREFISSIKSFFIIALKY